MPTFAGRAGIVAGTLIVLLVVTSQVARACSGPPYDPNEAAAIVEGRVAGVRLRPELATLDGGPIPTEVTLRVARVIWGAAPETITFIDYGSARRMPDGSTRFAGGGGACGILDDDPSDKYALIVFRRDRDGRLAVNRGQGAAFGDGPDAPTVQRLRQHITGQLRPTALPRTGGGAGAAAPSPQTGLPHAALALAGGLLLGGVRVARRAHSR